jgi:hypothetical protein
VSAHGTGATIPPVDEQVVAMKLVRIPLHFDYPALPQGAFPDPVALVTPVLHAVTKSCSTVHSQVWQADLEPVSMASMHCRC